MGDLILSKPSDGNRAGLPYHIGLRDGFLPLGSAHHDRGKLEHGMGPNPDALWENRKKRQLAAITFLNTVSIFEQTAPVLADSFVMKEPIELAKRNAVSSIAVFDGGYGTLWRKRPSRRC
jgi:hypothetical protein